MRLPRQFHHDVRCFSFKVGIDFSIAGMVHDFEEVHEIPLRNDFIGGNDGFNVEVGGELYGPHDPEWQTEYARRVAVVMRELTQNGKRLIFWVPPPTARDDEFNAIYGAQNRAVEQAAEAVPGARYVDVYNTINGGNERVEDVENVEVSVF